LEEDKRDALDDLFVERQRVDPNVLAAGIAPYARLNGVSREILPTEEWETLSVRKKILVWLLCKKAMRIKQIITDDEEWMSPSELEKETGIAGGSLRPALSKLSSEKLIKVNGNSQYSIPDHTVNRVNTVLRDKDGKS
jgi:hypothetical protein